MLGKGGSNGRGPKGPYVVPAWVMPEGHHPSRVAKSRPRAWADTWWPSLALARQLVTISRLRAPLETTPRAPKLGKNIHLEKVLHWAKKKCEFGSQPKECSFLTILKKHPNFWNLQKIRFYFEVSRNSLVTFSNWSYSRACKAKSPIPWLEE